MKNRQKDPRKAYSGIAERDWPVYESYVLSRKNVQQSDASKMSKSKINLIEKDSAKQKEAFIAWNFMVDTDKIKMYSLADPNIHAELLFEFLEIRDEQSAFKYVRERGFPGSMSNAPIQKWPCSELINSAAYLRWLMYLADAVKNKNKHILDGCIQVVPLPSGKQLEIIVSDPTGGSKCAFESKLSTKDLFGDCCMPVPIENEEPLLFMIEDWDGYGSKKNLYAAEHYLLNAINHLLAGIQPVLGWRQTIEGEWVIGEGIAVNSPWQAICYGLMLYITDTTNLRACKSCGNRFRAERSDREFCSDKCRKAYGRKYGQSVHSYPKKERGKRK